MNLTFSPITSEGHYLTTETPTSKIMEQEPKEMAIMPDSNCINIATISAGFEKGDFLVREEQGNRVYFDFFEEVRRIQLLFFGSIFSIGLSLTALLNCRHSLY